MKKQILKITLIAALLTGAYYAGTLHERRTHATAEHLFPEERLGIVGDGGIRVTNMAGQELCLPLQPEREPKVFKIIYLQQASSPVP